MAARMLGLCCVVGLALAAGACSPRLKHTAGEEWRQTQSYDYLSAFKRFTGWQEWQEAYASPPAPARERIRWAEDGQTLAEQDATAACPSNEAWC